MRADLNLWERRACTKCRKQVQVRASDGWTETHDCEPVCGSCGHVRFWHRPVCAGESEHPYICRDGCERFVEACRYCAGSGWLPERYVGEPYAGRWWCVCRFDDAMKRRHSSAWATAQAVVALLDEPTGQLALF